MKLYNVKETMETTRLSRATIYRRLWDNEDFPEPVKLHGKTYFPANEIDQWVAKQINKENH